MLRISRLADYGVVLATRLATLAQGELRSVRDLAEDTGIPRPTVAKVLKTLAREGVVVSARGARGGYRLASPATDASVAAVIAAVEGPIGVTECGIDEAHTDCDLSSRCEVRGNWQLINRAILDALGGVSLAQMAEPAEAVLVALERRAPARAAMEDVS